MASGTVRIRVHRLMRRWPGLAIRISSTRGTIIARSWKMIDAVMYGATPSATDRKIWYRASENRLSRPKTWFCLEVLAQRLQVDARK